MYFFSEAKPTLTKQQQAGLYLLARWEEACAAYSESGSSIEYARSQRDLNAASKERFVKMHEALARMNEVITIGQDTYHPDFPVDPFLMSITNARRQSMLE